MTDALVATVTDLAWVRIVLGTLVVLWAWRGSKRWLASGPAPLDPDDTRLAASVCVAASITLPALLLGSLGWLTWPAWILGVLVLATLVHIRANAVTGKSLPVETAPAPSLPFVLMVGGMAVGLALFVLRNPLTDRDTLQYHLPMWAHWVRSGNLSVALREPLEIYTAYPGGAELLQAFAGWAALDDGIAAWPAIGALVLLALVSRRLALRMGAAPMLAEVGILLLLSNRAVAGLGRGTQVDGLMAAWTLIALRFALRFRSHRAPRDMGLALVALALASGCRFTGPALAALVLLAALAWPPSVPLVALRRVRPAVWVLSGVLGGYWLVRNMIATGNPLYPAELPMLTATLPSPLPADRLRNTTQWAVWQQGYAGHLTLANVVRFYGGALALAAVGLVAPFIGPLKRERAPILAFVLATLVLYVFSPFSGANVPSVGGRPPELALDNVRYLLLGVALLVGLGAAALSNPRPLRLAAAAACAALTLWQLGSSLPRVVAGALMVAPFALAPRTRWGSALRSVPVRVGLVVLTALGLSFALRSTADERDRIVVKAWQEFRDKRHVNVLDGPFASRLRAKAGTQLIACVGLRSSHQLTGGDFVNQIVYLPVSRDGDRSRGTFDWGRDDRTRPDQAAWLQHVDATSPALLVLVHDEDAPSFPESRWAANDTARFTLFAVNGRDTVYSVRAPKR